MQAIYGLIHLTESLDGEKEIIKTKELKYKLCFVSPELHIANIKKQITFSKEIQKNANLLDDKDLICTKDYKIYSRYW